MSDPTIGHNRPDPGPAIIEQLTGDYRPVANVIAELEEKAATLPAVITNDDELALVTDHIALLRSTAKNLETARIAEKDIYLVSGRAVDGFFEVLDKRVAKTRKPLWDEAERYQQAKLAAERRAREEAARKAREEAARLRQEEADRQAAADAARRKDHKALHTSAAFEAHEAAVDAGINALEATQATKATPADMTRSRSAKGTVATMKTIWTFTVDEAAKVDLNAIRAHIPAAEVEKAIKRFVAMGGRKLDGVTIYETAGLDVR